MDGPLPTERENTMRDLEFFFLSQMITRHKVVGCALNSVLPNNF